VLDLFKKPTILIEMNRATNGLEKEMLDSVIASWDAYKRFVDTYHSDVATFPDPELKEVDDALMELMSLYDNE
jgi:hypothetical protein